MSEPQWFNTHSNTWYACSDGGGGFNINLINSPDTEEEGGNFENPQWAGHWNETIVTWAAQVVNFIVPSTYMSSYLPDAVDYSDAPAGDTSLSVGSSTDYENSYTYDWSAGASAGGIGGGASGSTTSTTGVSENLALGNDEGTLCYAVEYVVSGTVEFNAISRGWSFNQTLFDPQDGTFCNDISGFGIPPDWISNSTGNGAYLMLGPATSKWASGLENVALTGGDDFQYQLTISTTSSTATGVDFGFQVSATLAGVLPLDFQASEGWSQTVSSSSSTTLSYELIGPGSGVSCYNVFGEGGSASKDTADMVAIFYWTGSVVGGTPTCT